MGWGHLSAQSLSRPVRLVVSPGRGVGTTELVSLLRRPVLVLVFLVDVLFSVADCFLGRVVVSGPPRFVVRFSTRLLQQTVVVFSTFSSVCVVVLVWRVLVVHFWLALLSELESLSQSSVSAMLDSLGFCRWFCLRRNSTAMVRRKGI